MIEAEQRSKVEVEIRRQVDYLMRQELQRLKEVTLPSVFMWEVLWNSDDNRRAECGSFVLMSLLFCDSTERFVSFPCVLISFNLIIPLR